MNKKEKRTAEKRKKVTVKDVQEEVCSTGEPRASAEMLKDEVEVPNAQVNKNVTYGQRKQDRWVGFLRSLLDNPTKKKLFSVIQREVLQACTKRDAIPRKRVKFCNFVKHIYGKTKIIPLEVSSALFDKIKREFSKTHSNTRIDADDPALVSDKVDLEEKSQDTEKPKKIKGPKSRKRKSITDAEDRNEQEQTTVDNASNTVETKKNKLNTRKKSRKEQKRIIKNESSNTNDVNIVIN